MYYLLGPIQTVISWHFITLKKDWGTNRTVFNGFYCLVQQAKDYSLKDPFVATVGFGAIMWIAGVTALFTENDCHVDAVQIRRLL